MTDSAKAVGLPRLAHTGHATQLLVNEQPFLLLGGEVHNSSSSSLAYMAPIWPRLAAMHLNTVLVPVSWELLEPREGSFDFALVDGLLAGAREHGLRLVLLWFGTWKNTWSTYVPGWVKQDLERFPRLQTQPGRNRGAITAFCDEACRLDARAFAALMAHLRAVDAEQQTVIMVQVQNEVGLLGAARDHHPLAEAAFVGPVPTELTRWLRKQRETLRPELVDAWQAAGGHAEGTWIEVFGALAEEVFSAWHIASYVERVAASGHAAYPLPLFANAWLVQHPGQPAGEYPSGGPVARMQDIWRCAARHIELLAPDIYLDDFAAVCADYTTGGNPLLIPEAKRDEQAAANVWWAVGQHDALGFAPFGIDSMATGEHAAGLAASYRLLAGLAPVLAEHRGGGRMLGVLQGQAERQEVELRGYRLRISFNQPREAGRTPAAGLIVALGSREYLVAGHGFSVEFLPKPHGLPNVDFVSLDEGDYVAGEWVPGRRLNGDEYALRLGDEPGVRRARVYSYA